ncbi:hypothetical protein FJTKL_12352 [Diaporthe vaccinii]|uniref:Uncharacterized protein n=1 Tax=Diaporthe vaccinii TaxID=105482 RepID=A0ABR4EE06_9PEZI
MERAMKLTQIKNAARWREEDRKEDTKRNSDRTCRNFDVVDFQNQGPCLTTRERDSQLVNKTDSLAKTSLL